MKRFLSFRGSLVTLAGLGFFLWPALLSAQVSALSSVAQPGSGVADGAEPWAVVLNPAALAEARGFLLGLRDSEVAPGSSFAGQGSGLYVVQPLPYLSHFALGGGLELLRPGLPGLPDLSGKLTLALGYRILPELAVGLSYAHLFAPSASPSYDGLNTVSVGARLTASRFFAAGLMLYDLPAPRPSDPQSQAVERSYELELLTRPLGDHRLELAAGLRFGEDSHILWPRLRLWARPLRGFGIGLEGALAYHVDNPAAEPPTYRIGVGIELNFAKVGASGFVLVGGSAMSPSSPAVQGGSAALRFSAESYPALYRGRARFYRVELGKTSGESLLRLLAELRALERDTRARGVVVLFNGFDGGWGVADELRESLLRLRSAGRRVFAYGANFSQREFYIALAAERIYLDPVGSLQLAGISQGGFFFKDALERLGVRADLVRIGDYKSAPEMWTRNEPSEPAREQRQALIDDLYGRLRAAVVAGRHLPADTVEQLIEQGPYSTHAALDKGLVDAVATGEQVEERLNTLMGEPIELTPLAHPPEHPISFAPPGVAVLRIEGDIGEGRSQKLPLLDWRVAGEQTLLDALLELEDDPQVRAVVLRVDSPGGSALAADVLARQVTALSHKKPVLCSFGDVAASGGYYLSAPCAAIFTNPSTVTGSIGIFGGKVDLSGLLAFLGVRRVTLAHGSHADEASLFRPYSDAERTLLLDRLREGYDRFVETVMRGRSLSRPEVEARASGRVYSGAQAVTQKLCDRTGGLMDAVTEARRLSGLAPFSDSPIFYYPRQNPSLLGRLLGLPPDLFSAEPPAALDSTSLPRGLAALLNTAVELLPGVRTALLLLESDVLMRLETEPPR
jgi:protease-4